MTTSIFDIPHIVEAIVLSLSFADLRSCILVNHTWHDELVSYLWSDVTNFRSTANGSYETHKYYFLDPIGRESLAKHARHIQALTCQDSALLPALVECGCTNLIELNFVVEESIHGEEHASNRLPPPALGLDQLAKVIAINPGLQSVSLENVPKIPSGPSEICKELLTFVAFLNSCPSVTCFYMMGPCLSQENIRKMLGTILGHRLAALHPHDITALHLKSPRSISRSKRGPPASFSRTTGKRLHEWPARYGKLPAHPSWDPTGRWESACTAPYASATCFALLASPRSGVLEACMPPQILTAGVKAVLARCPEMVTLQVDALESPKSQSQLLGCLQGSLRQVCELRVDVETVDFDPLTKLVHDPSGKAGRVSVRQAVLSMVDHSRRWQRNRSMPAFLAERPHVGLGGTGGQVRRMDLYTVIVDLELTARELAIGDMLLIMAQCGNLERFRAKKIMVDERTPLVSPVWTCGKIQELSVGFVLDALVTNAFGQPQTVRVLERSVQAAHRIAPSLMEQVGRLLALRELGLHVNTPVKVGTSPFLQLAVGPLNGLGMLAQLGGLEKVEVSGLLHNVGHAELVWMKEHWPRLVSLSIPKGQGDGSAVVEDLGEQDLNQDYWKWRKRLKVEKGYEWSYRSLV